MLSFQVLRFNAYFKQTVHESQNEYFRVRPVDIYYYLEDDSIAVIEPHVENCGMPQGIVLPLYGNIFLSQKCFYLSQLLHENAQQNKFYHHGNRQCEP